MDRRTLALLSPSPRPAGMLLAIVGGGVGVGQQCPPGQQFCLEPFGTASELGSS